MQHLFLTGILCAALGIGYIIKSFGAGNATTISLHAAKHRSTYLLLLASLGIAVLLNAIFLWQWLVLERNLGAQATVLFTALLVCIFITGLVPDSKGLQRKIHRVAAYGIVFVMPLLLASLTRTGLDTTQQSIVSAAIAAQLFMITLLFTAPKARNYFLGYQAIYITSFFIAMLTIIYM